MSERRAAASPSADSIDGGAPSAGILRGVERALFSDDDAERLLRPRERRELRLHAHLGRRPLLRCPHGVEAVADAALEAGARVLLVRPRGVERPLRAIQDAVLSDDREVRARGRQRDLTACVDAPGPRDRDVLLAPRVRDPLARRDQRHVELHVRAELVRPGDDATVELAIGVEPRVRAVRVQRREPRRARLLRERLGAPESRGRRSLPWGYAKPPASPLRPA